MKKEDKILIQEAQKGNKDALSKILENNQGLIWSIVRRFFGRGYEVDDLYQIACIGFIESVQRFKFDFNVKLSTYSVQYMIGEIKKFLRDDGIIRISRSIKELGFKIKDLEMIYLAKTGESLGINKMSEILELPEETIYLAIEAFQKVESINQIQEDGKELIDFIANEDDEQTKLVDKLTIIELIKNLSMREKEIIILRYFKDKTQMQVANILGISQVHVSRLEKKILNDFKEKLLV